MRESCIQHRSKQVLVLVREDYYELTNDTLAAALLNEFEYRANAALIPNPNQSSVNVGKISIADFEEGLLGLSTDKQIRGRLKALEEEGFISIKSHPGRSPEYIVHIEEIQARLNDLGQITEVKQPTEPRSNNRATSVKQPTEPRSNNRASLYKNNFLERESENTEEFGALSGDSASQKTEVATQPKAIDHFAERCKSPNHPYPLLVREGLGHIWTGPKRTDFAEDIISATVNFLKKHNLPHGRGDARNAIAAKIRDGNWAWLELRLESPETPAETESETLDEVLKAIAQLLQEQNLPGVLPEDWQERTGFSFVSELPLEHAKRYRDELSLRRAA